ncbi:MAG: DUF6306 domain-containing protein [Porticoccaceae bacterium]
MSSTDENNHQRPANPAAATGETITCASPPCLLGELDPVWQGGMDRDELLSLLNTLLEAERAGARGLTTMAGEVEGELQQELKTLALDEARWCAMLSSHIKRLGGTPTTVTSSFLEKLLAKPTLAARLSLLDRGQSWVVSKLDESLPRIFDAALQRELIEMRDGHRDNIASAAKLAPAP